MMKADIQPCVAWEKHLAARHPDDLTSEERAALGEHLKFCRACAEVYADYDILAALLRTLPAATVQPLPRFSTFAQQQTMREDNEALHKELLPPLSRHQRKPPSRLVRSLNMVAAVLVVGMLISGMLLVVHNVRSTTELGSTTKAPAYCSVANGPMTFDDGARYVCLAGMFADLHFSLNLDGYTFKVIAGYVDANRLILLYTVTKPHLASSVIADAQLTLTDQRGIKATVSQGMGSSSSSLRLASFYYSAFRAPANWLPLPLGTRTLHLQLVARLYQNDYGSIPSGNTAGGPTYGPTIHSTITLPVHTQQRTVSVLGSVRLEGTLRGTTATLKQIFVTPSMVVATVGFSPAISEDMLAGAVPMLAVGKQSGQSTDQTPMDKNGVIQIMFEEPLFDTHGAGALTFPTMNALTLPFKL